MKIDTPLDKKIKQKVWTNQEDFVHWYLRLLVNPFQAGAVDLPLMSGIDLR